MLSAVFAAASCDPGSAQTGAGQRITTATGVRVRSGPSASAPEAGRLRFGTVVSVLEEGSARETIGGAEGVWLRIAPVDGSEGWIFSALATPYDEARREAIVRRIVAARLALEEPAFGDMTDLQQFVTSVASSLSPEGRAEMALARLRAMDKAAGAIPYDKPKEEPYASWIKAQGQELLYNEIGANWLVAADLYWRGAVEHGSTPVGDEFAWHGANARLPGECEGYLPCHLQIYAGTYGRYLRLYPRGRHADEALAALADFLDSVLAPDGGYSTAPEDRGEVRKLAAELKAIVAKAGGSRKDSVLAALEKLEKTGR
jgi:hypothetical protein